MNIRTLIEARKKLFTKFNNTEKDKEFTEAVTDELHKNKKLVKEIREVPFLLIELVFSIRDK